MIKVWTVEEFIDQTVAHGEKEFGVEDANDWIASVNALAMRAHTRGDGVAIYINQDLGHRDIGQWQVVSYGGPEAQLETRADAAMAEALKAAPSPHQWAHGDDVIPTTLPDLGGAINWRYTLEAIVPPTTQEA